MNQNINLLPVQKNSTETFLKILLQSCYNLIQNVGLCAARLSSRLFILQVVIQNKIGRFGSGKWDKLEVLRDVLPVVDKNRLDVVGYEELDSRLGVE